MTHYLEIYSKNRDRKQYPSVSQFGVPFTVTPTQVDDPVLSSPIYYLWSGTSADSLINQGNVNVFSTDSAVCILPLLSYPPAATNALIGYKLTIFNPVITSDVYGTGSTNLNPVLGTTASSLDNYYIGNTLTDVTTGEIRTIVGYNGSTKTVSLDCPFSGKIYTNGTSPVTSLDNGITFTSAINEAQAITYGGAFATISGKWTLIQVSLLTSPPSPNFFYSAQGGSSYASAITSHISGRGIAYGNGLWVAVGLPFSGYPAATIATSPDGQNWTYPTNSIFDIAGYSVAWNGSLWVAVGTSINSIAYSSDGVNWTGLGNSVFSTGKGVVWTGSIWYAVGTGANTIAYSTDGVNWTGMGPILFTTANAIAYGNGVWVVAGEGANTMAYSSDGINWTGLGLVFRNHGYAVAWNGSIFTATGDDYAASSTVHSIFTSSDGVDWTGVDNSSRYLLTGYTVYVNPTTIQPGNVYQIGGNSQSRLVIGYQPSASTCIPQTAFDGVAVNLFYTLTDPSTVYAIHIPPQDFNGNPILDIDQAYNGYYIIDETLSIGSRIVARKVIYYDNTTRIAYLDEPFPAEWQLSDLYTLRKEIPSEHLTLTSDRIPYINVNPAYGPIGPVIPFPASASSIDSYYTGKYVYYSSLPSFNSSTYGQFAPIYGTYLIKSYKGSTKEAFVNYSDITAAYHNMPYPYLLVTCQVGVGSNSDVIIISGNSLSTIPSYYRGYSITITQTGETRYITDNDQFYSLSLNKPLTLPIQTGFTCTIQQTGQIDIISFSQNNAQSLQYSGSIVSQNEAVCYKMALLELTVPNVALASGGLITNYPFVYVDIANDTSPNRASTSLIYSNNPSSKRAVFIAPVTAIVNPTDLYIKLGNPGMIQTLKFKPNDNLYFSIILPDGTPLTTLQNDFLTPYPANPLLQVHATFSIQRM